MNKVRKAEHFRLFLSKCKFKILNDASLDTLHRETVAWLKEIDFLREEMTFFYKLLHSKKFSNAFPSAEVAEIDKALVKLNAENLDRIKNGVETTSE